MVKKVSIIPANPVSREIQTKARLRVAAYCRVSTDSTKQEESYNAQVEYYTRLIGNNPLWEFVGVYADEGISGTKVVKRDEFLVMMDVCREGEIDLIVTKSITRFARNTVECIQAVRELKALGIGVFFEEENINTLTEKSELMLTILASIAQSEAEDISTNIRWSIVNRFETGTYIVSTPAYGYSKDEQGNLIIVEREANVVRKIFESYLNGIGGYLIAKMLNTDGIPTRRGGEKWNDSVVLGILHNPIYEGNMLTQKTYTENVFPPVRKVNYGEVAMYLTVDAHPPIVTHEEAEAVRELLAFRSTEYGFKQTSNETYTFSKKIVCANCGTHFRRQIIYKNKEQKRVIWVCKKHVLDKETCNVKAIREEVLEQAFVTMWNKLYTNEGTALEPLLKELTQLVAIRTQNKEIEELDTEIQNLSEQSRILNQVMMKGYMDSALFMQKNIQLANELAERRKKRIQLVRKQKRRKEIVRTEQLINLIKQTGYQKAFDSEIFELTVEKIQISDDHRIELFLKNGLVLTEWEGESNYAIPHANRI